MRIAILTHPLHSNYGGLLQAFALQHILRSLGHDAQTIWHRGLRKPLLVEKLRWIQKLWLTFALGMDARLWPLGRSPFIRQHTNRFIRENILTTTGESIALQDIAAHAKTRKFDAWVVGSDQVWANARTLPLETFLLDFLGNDPRPRRIAYAASLGKERFALKPEQIARCALLAKRFHAISVRETGGVTACEKQLGITNAVQMPDPTLLLPAEEYERLISSDTAGGKPAANAGGIFGYILDASSEKNSLLQELAGTLALPVSTFMPKKGLFPNPHTPADNYVYPPVAHWLRGISSAKHIVTDSFHGTVFALIFNKPFITLNNAKRGAARFTSLLKVFALEDRLVPPDTSVKDALEKLRAPIEWNAVNAIRANEARRGMEFLKEKLSENPAALDSPANNA